MVPVNAPPPDAPGKRERAKTEKRRRILAVADQLFRSRGYEETTTSLISKQAGIATGTLFLYFASKDELLIELFADRIRQTIDRFSLTFDPGVDGTTQLQQFFLSIAAIHEADAELTRHFIRAIAVIADRRISGNVRTLARGATLAIARAIIGMQRHGQVDRRHSPRTAAQVLFGSYFASLVEWANGGMNERQLHQRIKAGIAMVLQAMRKN